MYMHAQQRIITKKYNYQKYNYSCSLTDIMRNLWQTKHNTFYSGISYFVSNNNKGKTIQCTLNMNNDH